MQTIFFVNLNSRLRMKKNSFKGLYFENDKKNENHEIFFLLQNSKMQISNSNFFFFLQTKPKKKNVLNKHHGKYRKTFDNHKRALFFNKKKRLKIKLIINRTLYNSHIDGDDSSSSHRFFFWSQQQYSAERIFMMYTHNERIYFQHRFFSNKNLLLC